MKKLKLVTLVLASFIATLFIINSAFSVEHEELRDKDITLAIETQLALDEKVASHLINVETDGGVVTLSGSVDNILAKERAVNIAQSIKGVVSVIDHINVSPVARSDVKIEEEVVDALQNDPATEFFEIDVKVKDGFVTLTGTVDSHAESELCAEVAKGVKGVKGLKNKIAVSHKKERPDDEIKADIIQKLEYDVWVDDALIDVEVQDGNVTLTGAVGSSAEKVQAETDAGRIAGVKSVDVSGLEIKWWERDKMRREERYVTLSDEKVKKAVRNAFSTDPRLWGYHFDVDVNSGVVTLHGTVDNLKAKRTAEENAKNTVGVWRVKNHIKVRPEVYPNDLELALEVKEALSRDPYVDRYDLNVEVYDSKVYLNGTIDLAYERTRAEDVASRVKGVVDVQNNIMLEGNPMIREERSHTYKKDWEIREDAERQMFWDPYLDEDMIAVNVEEGVATLGGTVDTWFEYKRAEKNVMEAGARQVINKLDVKYGPEYYKKSKYERKKSEDDEKSKY